MAQNVIINNVTYSDVPEVDSPKSGGGSAKFYDTASADATTSDIMYGKKAYGPNGLVTGNLTVPTVSQDSTTKVLSIS